MTNNIVQHDIATLLDSWIEAERNGVQFPVPFDLAWGIAGYSRKDSAKRKLISQKSRLVQNIDYLHTSVESNLAGRSSDLIQLTCDAFKAFCLLAETEKGDLIRGYFIEAEKKWRLVQQISPQVTEEVEVLHLKIELSKQEAQRLEAERRLIDTRHLITATQPKAIADRIMGITEIQGEVKTRTVVVDQIGNVVNAGDTLTKTQIAHELGFINAKGKAETKQVAALVDEAIKAGAIPMPWREERTVFATGFDAELLPKLKAFYQASPIQRQKWIGE